MTRPTRERLDEIRKFSDKTIQTWSAMECRKEEMIYELLAEIDALEEDIKCKGIHTCHDECRNPMCLLRKERDFAKEQARKYEGRIDALEDENRCLNFNLEQKSKEIGRAEHRGNTVDYIYDKCETYSKQLGEIVSERDQLKERVAKLRQVLMEIKLDPDSMEYGFRAADVSEKGLAADNEMEKQK